MQPRSVANQQHLFFLHLREKTPEHISFINLIASLLNLSIDSVYRRVRGEKPLLMQEIYILCNHFNVSFDHFFSLTGDTICFTGPLIQQKKPTIQGWLNNLLVNLNEINAADQCELNIVVPELSCFHFFRFRELAIFKFLYWDRYLLNSGNKESWNLLFNNRQYGSCLEKAKSIMAVYDQIPVVEIWNKHVLNSILNQIEFVGRAGAIDKFESKILLEKLIDLISMMEEMVRRGHHLKDKKKPSAAKYQMMLNETGSSENAIVAECGPQYMVFLNYNEFWGWLKTTDQTFVNRIQEEINAIKSHSAIVRAGTHEDDGTFFDFLRHEVIHQITTLN